MSTNPLVYQLVRQSLKGQKKALKAMSQENGGGTCFRDEDIARE